MADRQVEAGFEHSIGLEVDGTVLVWGDNTYNQHSIPAGLSGVTKVCAGDLHNLALKSDGTVVAWDYDGQGQSSVPAGLSGVSDIAAGAYHSLALKSDGTVVAWGYDSHGQSTVPGGLSGVDSIYAGGFHSLALKTDGTVVAWGRDDNGQSTVPGGLTGVISVAAGDYHSLALKSDGTVVAWGYDNYGQATVPAGLTGVIAISAGGSHSVALKSDGSLVAWGYNNQGQTNIPAGLGTVDSMESGYQYSLAVLSDGVVEGWGANNKGQINIPLQFQSPEPSGLPYATLPIEIEVVTGSISIPITMDVSTPTAINLPTQISVYDQTELAGNGGSISGGSFSVRVLVAGDDYTHRLIGQVEVDAEEDAARVAVFELLLESGAFEPDDWINLPVSIDYIQGPASFRIFTGIVDLPELSLESNTVRISCTDNYQARFEGQSRSLIEGIFQQTEARWSEAVFGEYEDSAQFAEDMLSTIPASANLAGNGQSFISNWYSPDSDFTFSDSEVFPESISVEWASLKELLTQINVSLEFNYQFFRERQHSYSWDYPRTFGEYLEENTSLPTTAMVEQAADTDGWRVSGKIVFQRLPESGEYDLPSGGSSNWSISDDVRLSLTTGVDFTIAKRWIQDVRESYQITVRCGSSISRFGRLTKDLSGSLDNSVDESGFEDFESTPSLSQITIGSDTAWTSRSLIERDAGIRTGVARARTMILESMRQNSVSFKTLMQPELELYHYITLSSSSVNAHGKLRRIKHIIDLDSPAALTEVEVAVFRADTSIDSTLDYDGLEHSEDPVGTITTLYTTLQDFTGQVPEPPEEYDGYVGNYVSQLNNVPNPFDERFGFTTPEVAAESRDPIEYSEDAVVEVSGYNDTMTVNL